MLGHDGNRLDLQIADVAGHRFLNVVQASIDLFRLALDERLDRAIGQVAHEAGYVVASRHAVGRVAKAHALDLALEDNVFCDSIHRPIFVCG